jgi:hypothetical protein
MLPQVEIFGMETNDFIYNLHILYVNILLILILQLFILQYIEGEKFFMSFYDYKIKLNTDYKAAFDAFVKAGNEIGKIKTSDANNGEIAFKSGMNLLKMRDPVKYKVKFEETHGENIILILSISSKDGALGLGKKRADKLFAEFKGIIAPFLKCSIDVIDDSFKATHGVAGYLEINETERKLFIPYRGGGSISSRINRLKNNAKPGLYNYEDILSFELLEDGEMITSGGLGSAAVGGIVFGGAGAIVGAVTGKKKSKSICTSLSLKITVNDKENPVEYIEFINSPTKKNGFLYKFALENAQKCSSLLEIICNDVKSKAHISDPKSIPLSEADEILKFKNLLDTGVITQDEFELKKKQLLGL